MDISLPSLSLPAKLIFPQWNGTHVAMLGLGDMFVPAILTVHCLRFDIAQSLQKKSVFPNTRLRPLYSASVCGYVLGLLMAVLASTLSAAPQPALLYILPAMVAVCATTAQWQGVLRAWLQAALPDSDHPDPPSSSPVGAFV